MENSSSHVPKHSAPIDATRRETTRGVSSSTQRRSARRQRRQRRRRHSCARVLRPSAPHPRDYPTLPQTDAAGREEASRASSSTVSGLRGFGGRLSLPPSPVSRIPAFPLPRPGRRDGMIHRAVIAIATVSAGRGQSGVTIGEADRGCWRHRRRGSQGHGTAAARAPRVSRGRVFSINTAVLASFSGGVLPVVGLECARGEISLFFPSFCRSGCLHSQKSTHKQTHTHTHYGLHKDRH